MKVIVEANGLEGRAEGINDESRRNQKCKEFICDSSSVLDDFVEVCHGSNEHIGASFRILQCCRLKIKSVSTRNNRLKYFLYSLSTTLPQQS